MVKRVTLDLSSGLYLRVLSSNPPLGSTLDTETFYGKKKKSTVIFADDMILYTENSRGTFLAQLVEYPTLDPTVMSSRPMLSMEPSFKKKKERKERKRRKLQHLHQKSVRANQCIR